MPILLGVGAILVVVVVAVFVAIEQMPDESSVAGAKERATAALRQYTIASLDDATRAVRNGETVLLDGRGLDTRGMLHAVTVKWTVGDFGKQRHWQLEHITIDGRTVYLRGRDSEVSDPKLD